MAYRCSYRHSAFPIIDKSHYRGHFLRTEMFFFRLFQEIRALEKVIGDLLEGCHVNQAQWLARLFNHSCLELDVVMV